MLARTARPLTFGPMERIIVQGQEGDSLFVVVEGAVEVVLRRADGSEVNLGTRPHGTVLGEMSLLTGEPRSATVRALDGALVYEVGRRQYEPLLAGRPELVEALSEAMEARLRAQEELLATYDADWRRAIRRRWRRLASCEQLERVGAGGVLAERADVARHRLRQRVRLGQRDAVLRRHDHRRGEAGERQVGGREAVAAQVAAAVGEPLRDRVERRRTRGASSRSVVGVICSSRRAQRVTTG